MVGVIGNLILQFTWFTYELYRGENKHDGG